VKLARLQLYYDERKAEGSVSSDSGAEIRDGIKCAAKIGVGHERLWPYDIANSREAAREGLRRRGQVQRALLRARRGRPPIT
jgi:hypothetical protein